MTENNPWKTLTGITWPIVQAPMAGVATPALAAAVTNAGGLGSLGLGASNLDQARQMLTAVGELTSGLVNINLFCHQPAVRNTDTERGWIDWLTPLFAEMGALPPSQLQEIYRSFIETPEMLELLLEQRPAIVSFHFGLPEESWIRALQDVGIKTMATATSLAEARMIAAAGVDLIVAQGIEAGGHRGIFDPDGEDEALPVLDLVRQLVAAVECPVIAAGGIMTGQQIRSALDAGAVAAQLGTAFILCPESSANAAYRARLQSGRAAGTRLTRTLSGRPARGLLNRLIEHGESAGHPPVAAYPLAYDVAKQLNEAGMRQGVDEFAAQWAGVNASQARGLPAAEMLALLVAELKAAASGR